MAKFCGECGSELDPQSKFCSSCGTPISSNATAARPPVQAPPPPSPAPPPPPASAQPVPPQPAPIAHQYEYEQPAASNTGKTVAITAVIIAVILAAALAAYMFMQPASVDPALSESDAVTAPVKAEDPNAPRPQSWFDEYSDKFLSADLNRIIAGTAQKRNFPTARGSKVLETLKPGASVSGRWVEGADPKTRWLKTSDGGYIWEGNLAKLETITSAGMLGMTVNSSLDDLRGKIDPTGQYGNGDPSWDAQACETYASSDGTVEVMFEQGKATSFTTYANKMMTAKNIKVGSTEADLRKAYGAKLKEEQNPYDGKDYFVWDSKDRGIKFHVSSSGKVGSISAGADSIKYVEGCL